MEYERWLVASDMRPANRNIGGTPTSLTARLEVFKGA
jgi:hypothetical protein